MGRFARSKALVSASWSVLQQDKELMVLPLISGIAALAVAATFVVPIVLTAKGTDALGETTYQLGPISYVLIFLMYVALAYVTIFFRTALLCGADQRMRGEDPSLGSALSGAASRAGAILPWAIVSATVSVVLRSLEERAGILGRIVIGIVGMAWTLVTFLVLPILAFERVGVGEAVKRSAALFKQTWGENVIATGGIGLLTLLLLLPAFGAVALGGVLAASPGMGALAGVAIGAAVLWAVAVICWSNAMSAVFQLALYRFATDHQAPAAFATVGLDTAFAPKGGAFRRFGR